MSTQTPSLVDAALRGALAGVAGGLALALVEQAERRTILPTGADTTSSAAKAATAVAEGHDVELSRVKAEAIGGTLELTLCAALGAVFGIVHSRVRPPAMAHGLVLAGLAYAATSSPHGILPALGLKGPMEKNLSETVVPIGSHLAFGITTAAVFEATS